jgi:hypothetical protein
MCSGLPLNLGVTWPRMRRCTVDIWRCPVKEERVSVTAGVPLPGTAAGAPLQVKAGSAWCRGRASAGGEGTNGWWGWGGREVEEKLT